MRLWVKIGLGIVLLALGVVGVQRLQLETDILATLPPDLPEAQGLKVLRDGFSGGDELLIGLAGPDAEATTAAATALAEHLKAQSALVKAVQSAGTFEDPDTGAALLAWALQNAPPERLATLQDRLREEKLTRHLERVLDRLASSPDPAEVQRWSYDPLGLLEGVDLGDMAAVEDSGFSTTSADGTLRLLLVAPAEKLTGYKRASAWLSSVKEAIAQWQARHPGGEALQLHYTGEPSFMAETGSGIEKDLSGTIGAATFLIAGLFWFMFRRWKLLLWINLLLALVVLATMAVGGWVVGEVSIMSLGFASILMGIAVDYAVFILQEGMDHPHLSASALRRSALPPIFGGACTTSTVFLALLFSGLPGLADMGIMVALGVMAGLVVMVVLMPEIVVRAGVKPTVLPTTSRPPNVRHGLLATAAVLLLMGGIFWVKGFPGFQSSSAVLRPAHSDSLAAWDLFQARLGQPDRATVPLIATATDLPTLKAKLAPAMEALAQARRRGLILTATLPAALLPAPDHQATNQPVLHTLAQDLPRYEKAIEEAGFTEDALLLCRKVFQALSQETPGQGQGSPQLLPSYPAAAGVVSRFFNPATKTGEAVLLGSVSLPGTPGSPDLEKLHTLSQQIAPHGTHLAGWETLGPSLSAHIKKDLTRLMLPLLLVLAIMLALTFRNFIDFALCLLMLFMGIAALTATMALLGQSWNLANLAALPLLLGLGIDYGIHMLLAMKRDQHDISKVWATTGRAVFFCGVTTVIGFLSLVFASNGGVASLGIACSVGSLWTLLFALWLLPYWRVALAERGKREKG